MRTLCSRIVEIVGPLWATSGWLFFALVILLPLLASQSWSTSVIVAWVGLCGLWLSWWIVDAFDQLIPLWQAVVGFLMLGIGLLPRGAVLIIAAWVVYWMKVRE